MHDMHDKKGYPFLILKCGYQIIISSAGMYRQQMKSAKKEPYFLVSFPVLAFSAFSASQLARP